MWVPAHPVTDLFSSCASRDDAWLVLPSVDAVLPVEACACTWLCFALLIAYSSLGLFLSLHVGDLWPGFPQQ